MKQVKGQLTIFAFLLIGIIIALYLCGYSSPFINGVEEVLRTGNTENLFNSLISSFTNLVTNPTGIAIIGVGLALFIGATALTGGSGFLFGISIFFVLIFANYFVLPISFIFEQASWGDAEVLKFILAFFLNSLLILSMISFIRSGET